MAKESMKAREVKRAKLVEKYAEKRCQAERRGRLDWIAASCHEIRLQDTFAQPM